MSKTKFSTNKNNFAIGTLLGFTILLVLLNNQVEAVTNTFTDDFTTNSGWTVVNQGAAGQILIDSASFPDVLKMDALRGGGTGTQTFAHKDIGFVATDGDILMEFSFNFQSTTNSCCGPSVQSVMGIASAPVHPQTSSTDSSFRVVQHHDTSISGDPGNLRIVFEDGTNSVETPRIISTPDTYYIRAELDRSADEIKLSIFSDLAFTTHISGSPVTADATGIVVNSLQYAIVANSAFSGSARGTNAEVDNVLITTTTGDSQNQDPDCSGATPSQDSLFPPNHKMNDITINGVTDPDGDTVTLTVDGITQDEPTNDTGDGDTSPDGDGVGTDTAQIRAERSGTGDGRVYEISFTADDSNGGMCTGSVSVGVPHDKKDTAVDSGQNFDSTQ